MQIKIHIPTKNRQKYADKQLKSLFFNHISSKNSVLLRSIISYTPTRPVITGYIFRNKVVISQQILKMQGNE